MKKIFSTGLFCLILASTAQVQAQNNTFPATGNVGIGVINPSSKLEVNGNVRAGNYQTGAADVNSYSMEVGGPTPTQTNGKATTFLHHHGVIAHQLRYTSGTLFLEGSGNGYLTNNTPNFFVGGKVGAGNYQTGAADVNSYSMEVGVPPLPRPTERLPFSSTIMVSLLTNSAIPVVHCS